LYWIFEIVMDGDLSVRRHFYTVDESVQDVPKRFFVIELKADKTLNFRLESVYVCFSVNFFSKRIF